MTDANTDLGRIVLKGLVALREQKGQITLEDVGAMFLNLSSEHILKASAGDQFMYQEIKRLAAYIDEANREIFAIKSNEKSDAAILDASLHLDEVIKATEHASNQIMDAADAIQAAVSGIGGEKEKAIMDATNTIYGSCNFQDITGQRITKVIKLLADIEQRISKLSSLLSTAGGEDAKNTKVVAMSAPSDKDLLNGPQLPGQAASQAEIDQIFASLSGKK